MKTGALQEARAGQLAAPLRVLIMEDVPADVEKILLQLRNSGIQVQHTLVENREEFLRAAQSVDYEAILADYRLPGWNALDTLKELRANGKDIPFLIVTGTLGEEAMIECIKQGVGDYILKDNLARLPFALRRSIEEKQLREESSWAQAALAESEARARQQFEALLASEVRNRDLVENSVYGIFRATFDGSFLDANPALLAMLGCSSFQELQGLNLVSDIFRFPEQRAQLLPDCRDHGQLHRAEAKWRRRDGGLLGVRVHLRRLSIPNHPDAVECMAEDVTELRAMKRQLRQAQKFEAIGQLAGGIAHDFNNVVGAILGWAELGFEQNKGNPQVAERFARIREQADRAAALTRQLLAFGRRQVLQPRAVDLNSVTSNLLGFLDKVIGKDIEIKVVTAPLDSIKADPTQNRAGADESLHQRPGRHAARRATADRNRNGGAGRLVLPLLSPGDTRPLRRAFRL